MSLEQYSALVKDGDEEGPSATVEYDFGSNLPEAVELFGEDVVFKRFKAAAVVDLQGVIRRNLKGDNPKTEEEIQEAVSEWKPGVQKARKSKQEKALDILGEMSQEEKDAFLAELMEAETS